MARTGIWIAGAKGDIAATCLVGARAVAAGLRSAAGLTTALPPFDRLGLVAPGDLVFGGVDLSPAPLGDSTHALYRRSGTVSRELLDTLAADIDAAHRDIATVRLPWQPGGPTPEAAVAELRAALARFRELTSVEPDPLPHPGQDSLGGLERLIAEDRRDALGSGILYAYAALREGCAYLNFTPNAGTRLGAVRDLAEQARLPYYGDDGKTGETLVKTALAPMFACRNLRVLSWEGLNLLGNNDGKALNVPANRAAKLRNKASVLGPMLGYEPHGAVRIDYTPSLGDWKTAWDLIHFQGFLDVAMTLQFTWQGCDSILAAPLVLDMVRLADFALRRGEHGPMTHLAAFFKNPLGVSEMALWPQFQRLLAYAERHLDGTRTARGEPGV